MGTVLYRCAVRAVMAEATRRHHMRYCCCRPAAACEYTRGLHRASVRAAGGAVCCSLGDHAAGVAEVPSAFY